MLAISIILIVWLGIWLFFAWQRHEMLSVITSILIDFDEKQKDADKVA